MYFTVICLYVTCFQVFAFPLCIFVYTYMQKGNLAALLFEKCPLKAYSFYFYYIMNCVVISGYNNICSQNELLKHQQFHQTFCLNPYKPSIPCLGHRQTVQTQSRNINKNEKVDQMHLKLEMDSST